MNKEKFFRVVLPLIVAAFVVVLIAVHLFAGVKQTSDKMTHEAGKKLQLNVTDFFDVNEETAKEITLDTSKVDVNVVGAYEVTASYKMHKYVITVEVKDTQAPSVQFSNRYGFTNDISKMDLSVMVEGVYDASEYTLKLVRFEKSGSLNVMTEKALKALTDKIALPGNQEVLKNLGTDVVPAEEGIYRSVVSATDTYGNVCYEEVYVILDTTGARIEDVPDKEVLVSADKLAEAPTVNPDEYVISDNVDGRVSAKDIVCELELRDEAKHEWLVHVSYVDRAGNESTANFLIVVKEAANTEPVPEPEPSETPSENPGTSESDTQKPDDGDKDDVKPEPSEPEYTYKELNKTMYATSSVNVRDLPTSDGEKLGKLSKDAAVTVTGQCNETKWYRIDYNGKVGYVSATYLTDTKPEEKDDTVYDPADTDKDGVVDEEEAIAYTSPEEQKAIDAGYGNVVQIADEKYAVLMPADGSKVNGKTGSEILREYLAEMNLAPRNLSGGYINKEYYWYVAYNLYVSYLNPDTPEYWEENPWYDDEETGLTYFSYEDWINKENGIPYK